MTIKYKASNMVAKNSSRFITSREMRALETNAEYYGISMLQLMENAGRNVAQEVIARFPKRKKIAIFCGLGGNGGDGFVAARHLLAAGYNVTVILAGKAHDICHDAALKNWLILQPLQDRVSIFEIIGSSEIPEVSADFVIDALLGTGTKGQLKPPISQMVDFINHMKGFKLSIDVPTGVDSDTGEVLGTAVKADLTISFHKGKIGLNAAKKYVGELVVTGIGLPAEIERFAGPGDVCLAKKPRTPAGHKGDFGRLLVIGGNEVYFGAPALVSLGALRTGVDLVYLAAPMKAAYAISSMSPDLITITLRW